MIYIIYIIIYIKVIIINNYLIIGSMQSASGKSSMYKWSKVKMKYHFENICHQQIKIVTEMFSTQKVN